MRAQQPRLRRGPSMQGQKPRFGPGPPLQGQSTSIGFGRGRRCKGISSAAWLRVLLQHAGAVHPCPARTKSPCSGVLRSRGVHRFGGACGAGFDEATDTQVAKDAVVRGSGASRPWMACARLLEPWMAQPGDAHDPRTTAAPPEGDKSRRFGSSQKPASPQRRTKPVDSGAFQPGRILNQSPEKNLIPGLPGGPGTAGSTPRPCVVPPSGPG